MGPISHMKFQQAIAGDTLHDKILARHVFTIDPLAYVYGLLHFMDIYIYQYERSTVLQQAKKQTELDLK